MNWARDDGPTAVQENARDRRVILSLGLFSAGAYAWLAAAGDLRQSLGPYLSVHLTLCAVAIAAWWVVRRRENLLPLAIGLALLFRLVSAGGEPALSDDVFRYVWDGKVQSQGVHPYRHAPDDPALEKLRDEDWTRINHPELRTVYPPLSQLFFAALVGLGAGPGWMRIFLGCVDFAVILTLWRFLRKLDIPTDRVLLYAWNPLAVLESSGSGHVEPLGVLLVLLSATWIIDRRPGLSTRATVALAAAIQVKLLPLALVPLQLRRAGWRGAALLVACVSALQLPYALTGPAIGGGLQAYAGRWERNGVVFPAVRGLLESLDVASVLKRAIAHAQRWVGEGTVDWDLLYSLVWPGTVGRLIVAAIAGLCVVRIALRSEPGRPDATLATFGTVLLLSPTLHPWYFLWALPFAVAVRSWPWLLFGALLPLAYIEGPGGDVPWVVRGIEYGVPALLALALFALGRFGGRGVSRGRRSSLD